MEESKTVSEIAQSVVDACTDTSMKKGIVTITFTQQ